MDTLHKLDDICFSLTFNRETWIIIDKGIVYRIGSLDDE
jgi:hypothetical protein